MHVSLLTQEIFRNRSMQKQFTWPLSSGDNADPKISKDVRCTDKSQATWANQQDYTLNRHKQITKNALYLRESGVMIHAHSFIWLWNTLHNQWLAANL